MTIDGDLLTIPAAYDHITVAVAGSSFIETAIRGSDLLARASGAQLHLVHVNSGRNAIERRMRTFVAERVATVAPDVQVGWLHGDMLDPAEADDHYLASLPNGVGSVACHGYRGLDLVVGSVTEDLLAAGRPLVLFGPDAAPVRARRVAVCVDGTDWSAAVVPEAARWAAALDVPLWFVQAVPPRPQERALDTNTVHQLAATWHGTGIDVEWDVVHDPRVGRGLLDWLNEVPGTLTVAATHGRSGLARAGLGGIANQLIRHTKGPMAVQLVH
jgi:nucleotide-binding universal stress UspA family protein